MSTKEVEKNKQTRSDQEAGVVHAPWQSVYLRPHIGIRVTLVKALPHWIEHVSSGVLRVFVCVCACLHVLNAVSASGFGSNWTRTSTWRLVLCWSHIEQAHLTILSLDCSFVMVVFLIDKRVRERWAQSKIVGFDWQTWVVGTRKATGEMTKELKTPTVFARTTERTATHYLCCWEGSTRAFKTGKDNMSKQTQTPFEARNASCKEPREDAEPLESENKEYPQPKHPQQRSFLTKQFQKPLTLARMECCSIPPKQDRSFNQDVTLCVRPQSHKKSLSTCETRVDAHNFQPTFQRHQKANQAS